MRIFIKGGTWKNSEDEVLKAAVMKYGKNNWDRVASLLNRKSAKQCKARWYEWLDPSIKKTEWTREEEEKLLHLAKIMPTQWRTIAPIVGRTAAQCLEHYERLLDQAQQQQQEGGSEASSSSSAAAAAASISDPRRLRPGEVDPHPETRPARPDAVDMDEDEKEMLMEARARLANTKGKKAKRKAREKQLEEARRLASLQKKRELKAAGVLPKHKQKHKRGFIDYNTEMPYDKPVPAGFYDTAEEDAQSRAISENSKSQFINLSLQELAGKRRDLEEQKVRKEDLKKQRDKSKKDLPTLIAQINRANAGIAAAEREAAGKKRSDLMLPAPQITDRELEEIGKMGYSLEELEAAGATEATRKLLSDYRATPASVMSSLRTPSAAGVSGQDSVLTTVKNLVALQQQQTPLAGGSNAQLSEQFMDFGGVTPRMKAAATPNPLATPMVGGGATPMARRGASSVMIGNRSGQPLTTPMATPVRDQLNINDNIALADPFAAVNDLKSKVLVGLSSLPRPSTETYRFNIALPPPKGDGEEDGAMHRVEDMDDVLRRKEALRRAKQEEQLKTRTLVVQRGLPRPSAINRAAFDLRSETLAETPEVLIQAMVDAESLALMERDAINYPMSSSSAVVDADGDELAPLAKKQKVMMSIADNEFSSTQLADARRHIKQELSRAHDGHVHSDEEFARAWDEIMASAVVDVSTGQLILEPTSEQRIAYHAELYMQMKAVYQQNARIIDTLQKRLNAQYLHDGHLMEQTQSLERAIAETTSQNDEERIRLESLRVLEEMERVAMPKRLHLMREEVHAIQQRERELQREYQQLLNEKRKLEQSLRVPMKQSS